MNGPQKRGSGRPADQSIGMELRLKKGIEPDATMAGSLLPFPDFGNSVADRIHFVFEGPAGVVKLGQLL